MWPSDHEYVVRMPGVPYISHNGIKFPYNKNLPLWKEIGLGSLLGNEKLLSSSSSLCLLSFLSAKKKLWDVIKLSEKLR